MLRVYRSFWQVFLLLVWALWWDGLSFYAIVVVFWFSVKWISV